MLRNQKSFRFSRVKGFAIFAIVLALLATITTVGAKGANLSFIDSATEFFGLQTRIAPIFSNQQAPAVTVKSNSAPSNMAPSLTDISVALPAVTATPGDITVAVTVSDMTGFGALAYDFQVTFDPSVVQPTGSGIDATGTISSGATVSSGVTNAGHLIVSAFQNTEFTGSGTLLNLKFTVQNNLGSSTNLTFEDYTDPGSVLHPGFRFNETSPTSTTTNGSVTIPAATATNTATATDTPTSTNTATATDTPTPADTPTSTATETFTPTATDTPTATATETFTATNTNTATATSTATFTPTPQSICANGGNVEINFTPYATLTAAFAAINAGTHTGAIQVYVCADTNEGTGTALLSASGTGSSSYTSITVNPFGGAARTISGATTAGAPMIDFSGADNVTVDGLNTGGNSLTIANTTSPGTSGTSTIRFIGGATNNTITNCNLQGSKGTSVATNGAVVFFSTDAVTANGNDNNTISNNNIGPAGANLPTTAIQCNGSTSTTAIGNSGIIINNNNIFDYFGAAVTSSGVAVNGGCNGDSITNNRFYQTATRTWTTGAVHRAIDLNSSTATSGVQGMTVTGNVIGYASNTQTGTYTMTGSTGKFQGIEFNGITAGTVSNINNNTIASVSVTGVTSSGTGSTASPFAGILVNNGSANTNSNTIGSQSATGSLTFSTTTTTTSDFYGIYNFSVDNWTASNNNIGGMSITNLGASGTMTLFGLRANTGTSVSFTGASNNIGGTVANSMSLTATGASSQVVGMQTSNAQAVWTGNTVRNLTTNIGTGTTSAASAIGLNVTTSTPIHTLSQNTVHTLTNSNATGASTVTGIQFTGGTGNVVERNLIYNLLAPTTSTTAEINGIRVAGGTTTYRNNMIALGANQAIAIGTTATNSSTAGINGFNGALGTDTFVHNSVYIGGTATSGAGNSYALNGTQTTNARSFRDNIFQNARTNSGGTGKHYAVKINGTTANPTGLTINNNVYYANGASGAVFGFFNSLDVANLGAWKTAVGQDAGSFEGSPAYNDPTNATPDLHIHPTNVSLAEGNGVDVGVVLDYDGQTRSGLTPVDIGADAGNFTGVDLTPPAISYTAFANTSSTSNRTLSATITDTGGVAVTPNAPRIYFKKSTDGSYVSTECTGSYSCLIDYSMVGGGSVSAGNVIQYFVVAQDTSGNLASNPSAGFAGTNVNTVTTPPTTPNSYTITNAPLNGDYTVGVSAFARASGKTVTFEPRTRTVMVDVPVEASNRSVGAKEKTDTNDDAGSSVDRDVDARTALEMSSTQTTRKVAVQETYYVTLVNGVETDKPLRYDYTETERGNMGPDAPSAVYARVRDAVDDYNLRGVSGHTRFLLIDTLYNAGSGETFPYVIATTNVAEPSASATVTFQPAAGVTSTISGSSTSGIFVLGDKYLKIDGDNDGGSVSRDLTIQNTGTGANSYVIGFFNFGGTKVAQNGTVRYTNVQAGVTDNTTVCWGIILNGSGGDYDNALIDNNKIWQAYVGIGNYGVATTGINDNGVISNNTIGDSASATSAIKLRGIEVTQSNNLTIQSNDIFGNAAGNTNSTQAGVLESTGTSNLTVTRNHIHDFYYTGTGGLGCYGIISAANAGTTNIINNMIHDIKGDGDQFNTATNIFWMPAGITVSGTNSGTLNIDNNSIYMNGATLTTSFNGNSACISTIAGLTGINMRNNALRNSMTTVAAPGTNKTYAFGAIGATSSATMFGTINNNDYYVNGVGPKVGTFGQVDKTALADWQTATGQDGASISSDPLFISTSNLHIVGPPLQNAGQTLANVPNDFDGDSRPQGAAYEIGADENEPAASPTATSTFTPTNTATSTNTSTNTPTPTATAACTPVTFANATSLNIPGTGTGSSSGSTASAYPSDINVSGVSGNVYKVTVKLKNLTHSWPGDIDMMLVGPNGANAIVMSDATDTSGLGITNISFTIDSDAANPMPSTGGPALADGSTYQPTNYGTGDVFLAPAPAPSGNTSLYAFNGINPNGTWSLYISDDASGDTGVLAGGWELNITTDFCPTPTATSTNTDTPTATSTSTFTPTATDTPTATNTATDTPTDTPTSTNTATSTPTFTPTPTKFFVDTTADTQDAAPGDGNCLDAGGFCSLRAAITESNALGGAHTISLPAGTYTESLVAAAEDNNAGGDFDIKSDVIINGAGSGSTFVEANVAPGVATERVFHILGATATTVLNVNINNLTVRNGGNATNLAGAGIRLGQSNLSTYTFDHLVITDNRNTTSGGGLAISGPTTPTVNITDCTISNNRAGSAVAASAAQGGGLYNGAAAGTINVTNTTISGNTAQSGLAGVTAFGGGYITLGATTTFTNSTITNNSAATTVASAGTAGAQGAGVLAAASCIFNNSTISNNTATVSTGGSGSVTGAGLNAQGGTTVLNNTSITGNTATGTGGSGSAFGGGAAVLAGTLTIQSGSSVTNNTSSRTGGTGRGFAGGIYNQQATLNVIDSSVSGNTAGDYHAGIRTLASTGAVALTNITGSTISGNTASGNNAANGEGGGVINIAGGAFTATTNITSSTISGNHAWANGAPGAGTTGGGIENYNTSTAAAIVNLLNSTVSGNDADSAGGIYTGAFGAGVGTVNVDYSTIVGNSATTDGGGIYQETAGVTNLKDSVIANNTAAGAGPDIFGTITSQDYNHVQSTAGGTFVPAANDVVNTTAAMGALANNGGSTQTHLPGYPVTDLIPSGTNGCGTTVVLDQRGLGRPFNGACDKGAVESQVVLTPSPTATSTSTSTPTDTPTPTATDTPTATATDTATATATSTPTPPIELIYGKTTASSSATAGINLVSFMSNDPGTVTVIGPFTGLVSGHSVRTLDFRPATGTLYAISTNAALPLMGQLYTVDLTTAALTPVGGLLSLGTANSTRVEMDFNPVTDRIRLITSATGASGTNNNFRIDPNTGTVEAIDTNLAYDAGDPQAGFNTFNMLGAAYSNNTIGATQTTLYSWDYQSDSLVTIGGPNGVPSADGGLMFTVNSPSGFLTFNAELGMDISGSTGTLYVTHDDPNTGTSMNLYTRDTTTGAETLLGAYPGGTFVGDIAVNIPFVTPSPTATSTATNTDTPTPTATNTDTPTPTATDTPTATSTATNTPTFTPTAVPEINGTITYGNAVGLPAAPRFVSNVQVDGAGSPNVSATTGGIGPLAGQYTLSGFGSGSYTVTPTKTGGVNGSINSFDAGKIAQHVTALSLLTGNALVVADTSGNNAISSNDAALIARFVTSLGPPLGNTGQWRFYTVPNVPFPVGSTPTSRTYPSVTGTINNEDYTGLLIGEVSGNWVNTGARPAGGPVRSTAVVAPKLVTPADAEVLIPVAVQGAADKGIISYEFNLRYDPRVIQPQADVVDLSGTVSRGLTAVANPAEPGLLRVAVYGALPIDSNGVLMNLRFTAVGAPGTVSPLTWERVMFNEGDPGTLVTDGQVELSAMAPNQAEVTGRVVNAMGQGVANARVTLTDTMGASRSVVSDQSGVYRFGGLQVGQTFTVSAEARGVAIMPLTISITSQSVNVDMTAAQ